jgi:hypothetical protein
MHLLPTQGRDARRRAPEQSGSAVLPTSQNPAKGHVLIESDAALAWRPDDELDVVAAELLSVVRNGHVEPE